MAWIESHQTLLNHPKTIRAARVLGIQRVHLVGHLHALWWWAMDYAPSGSLAGFDPADIADAMQWEGDADALVDALVTCGIGDGSGFLDADDGGYAIHDWDIYVGKLLDKRTRDAARKRSERRPEDVQHDDDAQPADDSRTSATCPEDVQPMSDGRPTDIQRTALGRRSDGAGTVPTVPTVPTKPDPTRARAREPDITQPWAVVEDVFEVAGADATDLGRAERGRQSKTAKDLLADHDREAIQSCARWLWSQDFWRSRGIDVMTVRDQIPRWIAAGKPQSFATAAQPPPVVHLGPAYREFDPSEIP